MESKRQFIQPSDRVKAVDIHPTEPWLAVGLLNGEVNIFNYEKKEIVRKFEGSSVPVRAVVFIARKGWLVTGSDDKQIRIYDYATGECLKQFEAHEDFVRSIVVHPTQPFILTAGDDKLIKQWNWEKEWKLEQIYSGHGHYVMQIALNPNDTDSFASASMDNTVNLWKIGSGAAVATLEGHEKGVNCVSFGLDKSKSLLISGADDHLIKIWDYKSKQCLQTLSGHTANVTTVRFHPSLPIIISTAEQLGENAGAVRVWNAETYGLESIVNDGLDRAWCIQILKDTVAVGYDKGVVVHTISRKEHELRLIEEKLFELSKFLVFFRYQLTLLPRKLCEHSSIKLRVEHLISPAFLLLLRGAFLMLYVHN